MASSRFLSEFSNIFSETSEDTAGSCNAGYGSAASYAAGQTLERQHTGLQSKAVLTRTIETEIIPRLMLAHRTVLHQKSKNRTKNREISSEEVKEFARLLVQHDEGIAEAFAEAVIDQGAKVEIVFIKLFAPAARLLGEWWESDQSTFSEVTIGLSRIHHLVHTYSPAFAAEAETGTCTKSALLTPVPGEQHSLGILLLEQYLRRAGLHVAKPASTSEAHLINMVRQEHYDMIGISVTCDPDIDRISKLIRKLRKASRNREVVVMVGGRVVNDMPGFVEKVGADATDTDGSRAVERLEALVSSATGGD